jgi:hypothetical protein
MNDANLHQFSPVIADKIFAYFFVTIPSFLRHKNAMAPSGNTQNLLQKSGFTKHHCNARLGNRIHIGMSCYAHARSFQNGADQDVGSSAKAYFTL